METIIGFAAGYLTGISEGKGGFGRLRASLRAIVSSPEARRMATDAMSAARGLVRQGSARGAKATAAGVTELIVRAVTDAAAGRPSDRR